MKSLMIDRPSDSPLEAVAIIGGGETKDNNHPDINPLCWTEEFIIRLARAVKDAQADEKC